MKDWGIVGLGWLGQAFSEELSQQGQSFWGTHRTSFDFLKDELPSQSSGTLLLNTPPLQGLAPANYVEKVMRASFTKLIFISSTSVHGIPSGVITEATAVSPQTQSAQWLCEVETRLAKEFGEKLTVIRPGGLIGGERHPIKHLAGRTGLADGQDVVNLIHRRDLIQIILNPPAASIIHAVAPAHPRRDVYYQGWAQKLGLARPSFVESSKDKREIRSLFLEHHPWHCPELDFL